MTQGDDETIDGRSGFFGARPSGMHADAPAAATQPSLDDPLLAAIGYECAHPELQRGWPGAAPERG